MTAMRQPADIPFPSPPPPPGPWPKAHDVPTQPIRPQMPAPVPPKGGRG